MYALLNPEFIHKVKYEQANLVNIYQISGTWTSFNMINLIIYYNFNNIYSNKLVESNYLSWYSFVFISNYFKIS